MTCTSWRLRCRRISRVSWPSCPRMSMPCWEPVTTCDSACISCGSPGGADGNRRRSLASRRVRARAVLRLAGELAEIRAANLRFSPAETRELLATSGVVLSDQALATLQKRTEGWAAGLRIAALSLAEHPDPERFVAEFSGS